MPPFDSWATAATNIQDAIDVQMVAGGEVLVADGVYGAGPAAGRGSWITIAGRTTVRSVNGPDRTFIVGKTGMRCAYVQDHCRLEGFTLTNGHARTSSSFLSDGNGGGVLCQPAAVVSNCTIIGNRADDSGGGTYGGTIQDCTIINNDADDGGGTYGGLIQDCEISANSALYGGGTHSGKAEGCTVSGNTATRRGGGSAYGTNINCTIYGNQADSGGGTYYGVFVDCTITNNSAAGLGGGSRRSRYQNCAVTGNVAESGGGTYEGYVEGCRISGNSAETGGGTAFGDIQNCIISENTANQGGGTHDSDIVNCTVIRNHADIVGGTQYGSVQNSIVYYNSASVRDPNTAVFRISNSCTPDVVGIDNITNAPALVGVSNPHLLPYSPCIDAGTNLEWMAGAVDIDGEPRIGNGTADIGCDELHPGDLTGAVGVAIRTDSTNISTGFSLPLEADIQGRAIGYEWQWEDGTTSPDAFQVSRAYTSTGEFDVVLHAWNLDSSASATLTVHVVSPFTNYVSFSGGHSPPFASWVTAATNIQSAIGAHTCPGGVVLVTNGVYDTGEVVLHGNLPNRIAITNAVTVRSVNGPATTTIAGEGWNWPNFFRPAYVGANARLEGFTVTTGYVGSTITGAPYNLRQGGGVYCEPGAVVSDCVVVGNNAEYGGGIYGGTIKNCTVAENRGDYGGGIYMGSVSDCIIFANVGVNAGGGVHSSAVRSSTLSSNGTQLSTSEGGGAFGGLIQECAIIGNTAYSGGGAAVSELRECTIFDNVASSWGGGVNNGTVQNCIIVGNQANYGGGVTGGTARNCTIV